MRKKKKKNQVHRRISVAGGLLIILSVNACIWGGYAVQQTFFKPEPDENAIIADGVFFGTDTSRLTLETPEESGNTVQDTVIPDINTATFGSGVSIPDGCVTVPQERKNITSGALLQLDSEYPFTGVVGELVTFDTKNESYRMKNMELTAHSEVVDAMNSMAASYEAATGRADLMVYSTTSVYSKEGSLYFSELPDRATGYCVDLCILNEDGTISPISESNAWLEANSYLYGFIFSYTAADEEITGVKAAPYHLRYVGKEHASIMHDEGLTLAGYLEALKKHTIDAPFYYIEGGKTWSVYYVATDVGTTEVPVPLGADYVISGNNTDGFIVKAEALLGGE